MSKSNIAYTVVNADLSIEDVVFESPEQLFAWAREQSLDWVLEQEARKASLNAPDEDPESIVDVVSEDSVSSDVPTGELTEESIEAEIPPEGNVDVTRASRFTKFLKRSGEIGDDTVKGTIE